MALAKRNRWIRLSMALRLPPSSTHMVLQKCAPMSGQNWTAKKAAPTNSHQIMSNGIQKKTASHSSPNR